MRSDYFLLERRPAARDEDVTAAPWSRPTMFVLMAPGLGRSTAMAVAKRAAPGTLRSKTWPMAVTWGCHRGSAAARSSDRFDGKRGSRGHNGAIVSSVGCIDGCTAAVVGVAPCDGPEGSTLAARGSHV